MQSREYTFKHGDENEELLVDVHWRIGSFHRTQSGRPIGSSLHPIVENRTEHVDDMYFDKWSYSMVEVSCKVPNRSFQECKLTHCVDLASSPSYLITGSVHRYLSTMGQSSTPLTASNGQFLLCLQFSFTKLGLSISIQPVSRWWVTQLALRLLY